MSDINIKELTCNIKTKEDLYAAYMPFISNGGLFIKSTENFPLRQEIKLNLTILDDPEVFVLSTEIVWLTPIGAQGGKSPGFGVRLNGDEGIRLQNKIETHLAGTLNQESETDTM